MGHIGIKAHSPCFFGNSGYILLQYIQFNFARWSLRGKIDNFTRRMENINWPPPPPPFRTVYLLVVTTVSVVSPWTSPILPKSNGCVFVGCCVNRDSSQSTCVGCLLYSCSSPFFYVALWPCFIRQSPICRTWDLVNYADEGGDILGISFHSWVMKFGICVVAELLFYPFALSAPLGRC